MAEVIVAGGGVSGIAAAITSSSLGSRVTLLEESERIGVRKSDFHRVLQFGENAIKSTDPEELKVKFGIAIRLREKVVSADTNKRVVETSREKLRYDSLIIATGASPTPETMRGISKKRVYLMNSLSDYSGLSRDLGNLSTVVILGSTPLALTLAEFLAKKKIGVTVFSTSLLSPYLSAPIQGILTGRLKMNGVRIVESAVDSIAGMEKVEAVVSGGTVYPCEAVVAFPRTVPKIPRIGLRLGNSGGVLVDRMMKTSQPNVFAAGDCAELQVGISSSPLRLQSAAKVMGEVAGANAAGRSEVAHLSGTLGFVAFGLEFCAAGQTLEEATRAGFDAGEFNYSEAGRERDSDSNIVSCSLVYDRNSHVLYGVQMAGWKALSYADFASLAVSMNVRLEDLAYLESSYVPMISGDESPVATTAKKALSSAR